MKISVQASTRSSAESALHEAYVNLVTEIGIPDLLIINVTSKSVPDIGFAIRDLGVDAVHGATTCRGVITHGSSFTSEGHTLGILGISDPGGGYGAGSYSYSEGVAEAVDRALDQALRAAGRSGEVPDLVWLSSTPGNEEAVLERLAERLGEHVPVIGGSAADNDVEGDWAVFDQSGEALSNGLVLSVLFSSTGIAFAYHSGFEPADASWRVTAAKGRTLYELDGTPASHAYNLASSGVVDEAQGCGEALLRHSTFNPLGRIDSNIGNVPMYLLSHPASVGEGGSINLFSEVAIGDELTLMKSTPGALLSRPSMVAESALSANGWSVDQVAGGLIIFCGGCMLAVEDSLAEIKLNLARALPGIPFLVTFTFGEQGRFLNGKNRHGNLMISAILFRGPGDAK